MRVDLSDAKTEQSSKYRISTESLLASLIEHHDFNSARVPAGFVRPKPLPPIPNEDIAQASEIAFPQWANSIKRIQRAVCNEFGITISELCSQRRQRSVVRPRQIAIYLCKKLTDRSYPEIGRRFGRDHTTAISAVRRVEALCISDAALRARVASLQASMGGPLA